MTSTRIPGEIKAAIIDIKNLCDASNGRSQYFAPADEEYKSSVAHFLESSTYQAAGAVQPGSAEDLAGIIRILARHRAPFAVKGGGHTTNPGFSSTAGIQISMRRFRSIRVVTDTNDPIVHIGAGCVFKEVYEALVDYGLNIVGGSSIGGVGVAGWLLGGGYSVKTNQYGLGIDNLLQVEVVLPTGDIKTVNYLSTNNDDKLLFKAIKGGGNNFGIVTQFTVKAHQQGPLCGRLLRYEVDDDDDDEDPYNEIKDAILELANNPDPKASFEPVFRYSNNSGRIQSMLTVQCFYDGPLTEGSRYFARLLRIKHVAMDGDTFGFRNSNNLSVSIHGASSASALVGTPFKTSGLVEYGDYYSFDSESSLINEMLDVKSPSLVYKPVVDTSLFASSPPPASASGQPRAPGPSPQNSTNNQRGRWGNVMLDVYTRDIIDEMHKQAKAVAQQMTDHGGNRVAIGIWPFSHTMFNKATDNPTDSAWPHVKGSLNSFIIVYFYWEPAQPEDKIEDSENNSWWVGRLCKVLQAIRASVKTARESDAVARGEPVPVPSLPVYMNTALETTTRASDVYGENFTWLREAKQKFDPKSVMYLTGGFRL